MRNWRRQCPEYRRICDAIIAKYKGSITIPQITSILKNYLLQCKRAMLKGEKIALPSLIKMKLHNKQVSKIKLSYRQRKIRYSKSQHFKKHIFKSGTAHHKKNKEAAKKYLQENLCNSNN